MYCILKILLVLFFLTNKIVTTAIGNKLSGNLWKRPELIITTMKF